MSAQDSLFDSATPQSGVAAPSPDAPLADRLRPQQLDQVIGQRHLLGPGRPLRVAFESGRLHSMILWGPPGVGKTTLARLVASMVDAQFIVLSAVLSGVKEIREAVERARAVRSAGRATVVFVDEVHRFNKAQQDAFLPHVESGLFTFIGATTENPSFEVNSALLSRATVHVLKPLEPDDLIELLSRAKALLNAGELTDAARDRLIGYADGDARRLLNAYENLVAMAGAVPRTTRRCSSAPWARCCAATTRAASSSTTRSRRCTRRCAAPTPTRRSTGWRACSTVASTRATWHGASSAWPAKTSAWPIHAVLRLALDAAEVYERLGSPEGELALAQAVVYLSIAPKSNATYTAWGAVRAFVREDGTRPVPLHLRNAPTRLMKQLGYGSGYRYAHDEPEGFAAGESYWPDDVAPQRFYEPVDRGLEQRIAERLAQLRALDRKPSDTE